MKMDELKNVIDISAQTTHIRNLRCPHCGKVGAFHGIDNVHDAGWALNQRTPAGQQTHKTGYRAGVRLCPNPECHSIVLVSFHFSEASNIVYPFEVIKFDPSGIPVEIIKSFKEALISHSAACYRASALMVRRTLEEICQEQKATGSNLKERIAALGAKIVIPKDLIEAADELRLLGNDAAHIESQEYATIGPKEVEISISFVKEILKATYQYATLLSQLRALKKP